MIVRDEETIRLIDSLHLQEKPDGGALVVDDRTFTAAHANKAARLILEALQEPRTRQELSVLLADAAGCAVDEAVAPVVRLVDKFTALGWIESARGPARAFS